MAAGARPAGRLGALLGALLLLGAAAAACESEGETDPIVGFLDAGRDATGGGVDTIDVVAPPDVPPDVPPLPDVPADTGGGCFVSPYVELAIAAGAYSSYTRGEAYPSIRQWTDRGKTLTYRGLLFAERHRRGERAAPFEQFSDANPDRPLQHVYAFDKMFGFFPAEGDAAIAIPITTADDPEVLNDTAIRVKSVPDGWAAAMSEPETPFSYDLQDLVLQLRVKAPRLTAGARVLVSYTYKVGQNSRKLTWVLAGDPGTDTPVPDPQFQLGAGVRSVQLPFKQQIIEQFGESVWTEGSLVELELRVEGDAEVIFDEIRLQVTAWWDDYRAETTKYYLAGGPLLIPGVEHYFPNDPADPAYFGQVACVSPGAWPATDGTPAEGLFDDFAATGCLTIANRPWAPGAGMLDEYVRQAEAAEVWHPLYTTLEGAIALEPWTDLLLAAGPRTAVASSFARDTRDLTRRTPHNRVLVASPASEAGVIEALRAGRSYMTDDLAAQAELWAERPDCARAEVGEQVTDAVALHVRVSCPTSVANARLVQVSVPEGVHTNIVVEDAAEGAVIPVRDWAPSFVRLEAACAPDGDDPGARIYTNPIWLTDTLP